MRHYGEFKLMCRLWFVLVLLCTGTNHVLAATMTENFDNVDRLDANGNVITSNWTYGYSLSNGWFVSPATNAISASKTMYYGIAAGGNTGNALWNGYGSSNSYYMVIPTLLQGEITFKAYKNTSSKTPSIKFFEVTENNGVYTVTDNQLGETVTPAKASWEDYSINIGEEGKYIAIHMILCGLDDFAAEIYDESGTLAKPTDFTVTEQTYNASTFSWTAGGEETAWQLVFDTNADFDKDATTPVEVTENPYTLTGLAEGTTYYAALRAKKGEEVSAWTSKVNFTTTQQFPKPTGFALTDYTATSATFTWTAGSTETAWQISYDTQETFVPAEGTIVNATANPYTIDNLLAETTYYACIRADYGEGNYSGWSEKVSFKPSALMNVLVNDDTKTNVYIPFYASYVDTEGTKSQFIIPAESLAGMTNRQITKMTFYANGDYNWGAKFKVYLQETDDTEFTSKECDFSGMDVVAEATVSTTDGQMIIEFDTPFDYANGNLMVGFNLSATGTYKMASWYGVNATTNTARYSYQGYSGVTNEYSKFLPKMTITSVPGSAVAKPKLKVTQPANLSYGIITQDAVKTFTVSNTGKAPLEGIQVTSSNEMFTISGAPTTLAPDASQEVTITMSAASQGSHSSDITISATDVDNVKFTVTGFVMPQDAKIIDFNDNTLPTGWTADASWVFDNGSAKTSGYKYLYMTSPKLTFTNSDFFVFKVRAIDYGSGDYVNVEGSDDNGETWTAYNAEFTYNNGDFGANTDDFTAIVVPNIPKAVNKIRFKAYYVEIDDIAGLNYAPAISVDVTAINFGKQTADAKETVTVTNAGSEPATVNIASDSEDFTAEPAVLENIAAGESKQFTVTFKYSEGNYGVKSGHITVTPTFDTEAAVVITATAKTLDPATWTEDFTAEPTNWEAGANWTFENGVAKGSYASGTTDYLTTPKLDVSSATEELTFDYKATSNFVTIQIQISKDGADFTDYQALSNLYVMDNFETYTITGLEPGTYQFRFANDNYELDNFEGFVLHSTTTGIRRVDSLQFAGDRIYNLNGQEIQRPTKGLYIVNGKTLLIK